MKSYLIELQRTYTSTCSANSDCQTALNLICTTSSFQCNCPSHLPAYTCDCAPDKYFDYVAGCRNMRFFTSNSFIPSSLVLISPIEPRKNYNELCTETYNCVANLNLICSNNKCSCPDDWYWTGSICGKTLLDLFSAQTSLTFIFNLVDTLKNINGTCSSTSMCLTRLNLKCITGVCKYVI